MFPKNAVWLLSLCVAALCSCTSPSSPYSHPHDFWQTDAGRVEAYSRAFNNDVDGVREYLTAGGDVNMLDDCNSGTLLSAAALGGARDVTRLLLKAGANKELQDMAGMFPAQTAVLQGHDDIAELLRKKTVPQTTNQALGEICGAVVRTCRGETLWPEARMRLRPQYFLVLNGQPPPSEVLKGICDCLGVSVLSCAQGQRPPSNYVFEITVDRKSDAEADVMVYCREGKFDRFATSGVARREYGYWMFFRGRGGEF